MAAAMMIEIPSAMKPISTARAVLCSSMISFQSVNGVSRSMSLNAIDKRDDAEDGEDHRGDKVRQQRGIHGRHLPPNERDVPRYSDR